MLLFEQNFHEQGCKFAMWLNDCVKYNCSNPFLFTRRFMFVTLLCTLNLDFAAYSSRLLAKTIFLPSIEIWLGKFSWGRVGAKKMGGWQKWCWQRKTQINKVCQLIKKVREWPQENACRMPSAMDLIDCEYQIFSWARNCYK